jgi:hypothetical protein
VWSRARRCGWNRRVRASARILPWASDRTIILVVRPRAQHTSTQAIELLPGENGGELAGSICRLVGLRGGAQVGSTAVAIAGACQSHTQPGLRLT